jgi:hypothetical protein
LRHPAWLQARIHAASRHPNDPTSPYDLPPALGYDDYMLLICRRPIEQDDEEEI